MTADAAAPQAIAPDTVPAVLARRVAESPDAVAFQTETAPGQWSPVTWAGFASRVERLRRGLHAAGLRPGDRLAIIAPVSLEWELLHHAALSLGLVVASMDSHDLPERIAAMVELADITGFAVASPKILACLKPERWTRCRLALQLSASGDAWPAGARPVSWDALNALGAASGSPVAGGPGPKDDATIIFTSGTTGAPKGITYRHEQVCLAIGAICDAFPFVGPGSRLLCWLPLSNLFQRIVNLAGMRSGAASYLLGDPRRVMDVVGSVEPDVLIGVPRFYEKLYDGVLARIQALPRWQRWTVQWAWKIGRQSSPFRQRRRAMPMGLLLRWTIADRLVLRRVRAVMGARLQCMVTGSAPTRVQLLEEFYALGWLVLEAYGMSENVMPLAMNRPDRFRMGSVGSVTPGNEIAISTDGRLRVRGPGVFDAYLGEPHGTRLDADDFFTSGDLARIDEQGFVWLRGRVSDFIKTSTGRRIAPTPIEDALREVHGIDQAVVVGNGRRQIAALVTLVDPQAPPDSAGDALQAALQRRLADLAPNERPAVVVVLDRPLSINDGELTPNLKLRRDQVELNHRNLIDRAFERLADGLPHATPRLQWARTLRQRGGSAPSLDGTMPVAHPPS